MPTGKIKQRAKITDGIENPHLASALLNHSDSRVTYDRYIRSSTIGAVQKFGDIIRERYKPRD